MKEVTIEEKAKAYDEAIKRAKVFKEHLLEINDKGYVDEMDYIFPELQESEDEEIRKFLIQMAQNGHGGDRDWWNKCVAWLEKQGEQKGLDYPYVTGWRKNYKDNKPKVKHSVLMFTTHGIAEGEWLGEEWCQYRWSCKIKDEDVLYWLHLSDLENLEKENVEQKPADKVEPIVIRDFNSVFSREQVEEIDKRIEESQRLYIAKLRDAMRKVEDFPMTD